MFYLVKTLGIFQSMEEVQNHKNSKGIVIQPNAKPGDLKYDDYNDDGQITQGGDQQIISDKSPWPKAEFGLTFNAQYKNFDFQAVGTGRFGGLYSCTGDYFWSGWGDGNYTAFVRDNIGGDYPRLSYVKSTNNFVASDFWLRKCDWFKIQDVCLSYTLPLKGDGAVKGLSFSIKGQNLATFTNFKYLDPEAPSAGYSAYPLFRTITAGARINF